MKNNPLDNSQMEIGDVLFMEKSPLIGNFFVLLHAKIKHKR